MSALVTEAFHVKLAKEFVESLSTNENDNLYLFIGRGTPWASNTTPPSPNGSVANATYDYWRDMFAMVRVNVASDVYHVVPRYDWAQDTVYSMYDHRVSMASLVGNTTHPFYVVTDQNEVFKCIDNGRVNATSGGSQSTVKPDIDLVEDITQLITTEGSPRSYQWKYLYTIESGVSKFKTTQFIPVRATADQRDISTGDVLDDNTDQYTVFDAARQTGNGAIYAIVVENPGSGYVNAGSVVVAVIGDGVGANATAVIEDGAVSRVYLTGVGRDYSYARVEITGGASNGANTNNQATATAIISPRHAFANTVTNALGTFTKTYYRSNHAIDLEHELGAKHVMIHKMFSGTGPDGVLPTPPSESPDTAITYRRVGLVRNPMLRGTANVATGNAYSTLTTLQIGGASSGIFRTGEIVWQAATNAYAVVAESTSTQLKVGYVTGNMQSGYPIVGIGNGLAGGQPTGTVVIPATPESFSPAIAASGATATVDFITPPPIDLYSGEVLFVNHVQPVSRAGNDTESIRIVLTF